MTAQVKTFSKPIYLHRYRSLKPELQGSLQVPRDRVTEEFEALEERFIYCSTYRAMNDPMEGLYKSIRSARLQPEWGQTIQEIRDEKVSLGIASFSETWDHPLMWAHYADGFRGLCVAYHLRSLVDELSDEHFLTRLAYADRPHMLNLVRAENREIRAKALLSQKSVAWNHEREWRLFAPTVGKAEHGLKAIHHVYLGSRMPRTQRTQLTRRLERAGIKVRPTRIKGYTIVKEKT